MSVKDLVVRAALIEAIIDFPAFKLGLGYSLVLVKRVALCGLKSGEVGLLLR